MITRSDMQTQFSITMKLKSPLSDDIRPMFGELQLLRGKKGRRRRRRQHACHSHLIKPVWIMFLPFSSDSVVFPRAVSPFFLSFFWRATSDQRKKEGSITNNQTQSHPPIYQKNRRVLKILCALLWPDLKGE